MRYLGITLVVLLTALSLRFALGVNHVKAVNSTMSQTRLELPAVEQLQILPLVEFETEGNDLKTEAGLSYLITTERGSVLLDLGYNKKREDPSPLLYNARKLGIELASVGSVVVSHAHVDHAGGIDIMKRKEAWSTASHTNFGAAKRFAPIAMQIDGVNADVLTAPRMVSQDVGSTGALAGQTFFVGRIPETSLLVNVRGKGLVVISGCGHPGVVEIAKAAQRMTGLPLYAVAGGFHLYYGRCNGGLMPSLFGASRYLGLPESRKSVLRKVKALKDLGVKLVYMSPHDANDQTGRLFQEVFRDAGRRVIVGKPIIIVAGQEIEP